MPIFTSKTVCEQEIIWIICQWCMAQVPVSPQTRVFNCLNIELYSQSLPQAAQRQNRAIYPLGFLPRLFFCFTKS